MRADHIRRTYGRTVPETPSAEPWLLLGHCDDQKPDRPDRWGRWQSEERDNDREDR
jgi:hypothetical protein